MEKLPLVSVVMIAYGHEKFIEEAINSVLMQECDFKIELILANDASPDNTDFIIQNILKSHQRASIIKYIKHEQNMGMMPNFIFALQQGKSKYIALCEGDDYWIDPLKLQKQVNFLEENDDYSICTHVSKEINEIMNTKHVFPSINENTIKTIEDYIISNHTATCSMLFKSEYFKPLPHWFKKVNFGDWGLVLILFYKSNKNMMILNDCMGIYRVHSGGIHGVLKNNNLSLIKAYKQHIKFFNVIKKNLLFEKKYRKHIFKKYSESYKKLMNLNKKEKKMYNYYKFKLLSMFYDLKI